VRKDVIAVLDDLTSSGGELDARQVREVARDPVSPLHRYFTWDDGEAAERYRLGQAERLIRRYKLTVTTVRADGEVRRLLEHGLSIVPAPPPAREFQAAARVGRDAPAGTYVRVTSLTGTERGVLLAVMEREIRSLRARYGHYSEFWEVIARLAKEAPPEDGSGAAASG
jgi:hypothetical protein